MEGDRPRVAPSADRRLRRVRGAWATGLAPFEIPALAEVGLSAFPPAARFGILFALSMTLVSLLSFLSAVGEEIGWRGYLLTRLVEAEVPRPVLLSGVVWAVWHLRSS
jgi:CAAX amino terminal protease family.